MAGNSFRVNSKNIVYKQAWLVHFTKSNSGGDAAVFCFVYASETI